MSKEKLCGIYCIENEVNHKKYIGLSRNIEKRFKSHKNALNGNYHINKHLQSAWNKYGENNFAFYIIEKCNENQLKKKEIYYIKKYKSANKRFGYNKTSGGDGVKDLSNECSDKKSISKTLYPVICFDRNGNIIKEYRNCTKAAEDVNGRTENIRQCCNGAYGYKTQYNYIWMYKEDYLKKGIDIHNYQKSTKAKSIDVYDLYGKFINTFENGRIIEKELGIPYRNVSQLCHGEKRQSHGYICRFHNNPFNEFETARKNGMISVLR